MRHQRPRPGHCLILFLQISFPLNLAIDCAQKAAQRSEDEHILLHDICCLWVWLRPKMAAEFPGHVVKRHDDLFAKGFPECNVWGRYIKRTKTRLRTNQKIK